MTDYEQFRKILDKYVRMGFPKDKAQRIKDEIEGWQAELIGRIDAAISNLEKALEDKS